MFYASAPQTITRMREVVSKANISLSNRFFAGGCSKRNRKDAPEHFKSDGDRLPSGTRKRSSCKEAMAGMSRTVVAAANRFV